MTLTRSHLEDVARSVGLDGVGLAEAGPAPRGEEFSGALREPGYERLGYLARDLERRLDPRSYRRGTRSLLLLGLRYTARVLPHRSDGLPRGRIAAFAHGPDYHKLLRERMDRLVLLLQEDGVLSPSRSHPDAGLDPRGDSPHFRVVDTAPVLEKVWAQEAGLGWQGKNTHLVHKRYGSWLLLGAILTPDAVEASLPAAKHCGSCNACLEACPTGALDPSRPGRLDPGRCISYWTIEHRSSIPEELRPLLGDWIFGCDLCLEPCPFNRFHEDEKKEAHCPELASLLEAPGRQLARQHRGLALAHASPTQWKRNAAIAAGNAMTGGLEPRHRQALVRALEPLLDSESEVLVEAAQWALERS